MSAIRWRRGGWNGMETAEKLPFPDDMIYNRERRKSDGAAKL
jgi:hypothetical protein